MSMATSYYNGEPDEETRQHFANIVVSNFQLCHMAEPVAFPELLDVLRDAGRQYDRGVRLRDLRVVA